MLYAICYMLHMFLCTQYALCVLPLLYSPFPLSSSTVYPPVRGQHRPDMPVKPVSFQRARSVIPFTTVLPYSGPPPHTQPPRPLNPTQTSALPGPTPTLKRPVHLPLGTRIEERQLIAYPQRSVIYDPGFHSGGVEDEGRVAGVVGVEEVGV